MKINCIELKTKSLHMHEFFVAKPKERNFCTFSVKAKILTH